MGNTSPPAASRRGSTATGCTSSEGADDEQKEPRSLGELETPRRDLDLRQHLLEEDDVGFEDAPQPRHSAALGHPPPASARPPAANSSSRSRDSSRFGSSRAPRPAFAASRPARGGGRCSESRRPREVRALRVRPVLDEPAIRLRLQGRTWERERVQLPRSLRVADEKPESDGVHAAGRHAPRSQSGSGSRESRFPSRYRRR